MDGRFGKRDRGEQIDKSERVSEQKEKKRGREWGSTLKGVKQAFEARSGIYYTKEY